jgi:hypothetical protein
MFLSTAIEIIKWVKQFAVALAKVTYILRPGKASEKTPKGVIPPSLCEISQNASRKKRAWLKGQFWQDWIRAWSKRSVTALLEKDEVNKFKSILAWLKKGVVKEVTDSVAGKGWTDNME